MTVIEPAVRSRPAEKNPLAMAVVLSLVIHLALFGTWHVGKQLGWWNHHAQWLVKLTQQLARSKPRMAALFRPKPKPPEQRMEIPLYFVEVDPETVVADAPKDAKYYSSKNAKASNPDPAEPKEVPKVDGKQDQIVRLKDIEKPLPFPLQPSPPQPKPEEQLQPKPKATQPGDLALIKPKPPSDGLNDSNDGKDATIQKERPRTIAQALAAKGLVGQKMRQEGGVEHRGKVAFDVKATPFGAYDEAFIAAVEQCWHNLLNDAHLTQRSGRVVLEFKLNADGRITDMHIAGNQVGEIQSMLCQRAVEVPAPYPRWPADMRHAIGSTTREIRFSFIYY